MIVKEPQDFNINLEITPKDILLPRYEEVPPHPKTLSALRWDGPAYLVTAGSKIGIYRTWNETGPLVQRTSANIHKRYASWKEAFEVYKRCYEANLVHIIDFNIAPVSYNLPVAIPEPFANPEQRIPAPGSICRPASNTKTYYAVTTGRKLGVYDNWDDTFKQIKGVAGNPKKYKNWDDALNEYKEKYEAGEVQVKM